MGQGSALINAGALPDENEHKHTYPTPAPPPVRCIATRRCACRRVCILWHELLVHRNRKNGALVKIYEESVSLCAECAAYVLLLCCCPCATLQPRSALCIGGIRQQHVQ